MNGFRTFLASLQFTDDRFELAPARSVEWETTEPDGDASDCERERTEDQQIAA